MPDMVTGLISAGASLLSGSQQSSAAQSAANTQAASSDAGIAEQRRQFEEMKRLLTPYVNAGTSALGGLAPYAAAGAPALAQQQALAGLSGTAAQQQAINAIEQSPLLQSQMRQGESALLQNASATGGLRGGNIQGALAQFRPAMLQEEIDRQYNRLGGMTTLGQLTTQNLAQLGANAAAGTGTAGLNSASNIANLMAQQGAAQAGGALGQARATSNVLNSIPMGLGLFSQLGGGSGGQFNFDLFGGTGSIF